MKWNRCTFTVWPWQDLRPFFLSERRALFSTWFLTPCNLERNAWDGRRETFVDFWAGVEGLVPWNYQKVVSWVEAQVSSDCNGRELGFSSWSILTSSKVWATPCVTHPLLQTFLLWFVGIGTFEHHFAKKKPKTSVHLRTLQVNMEALRGKSFPQTRVDWKRTINDNKKK